jgi:hypothetical protein
VKKVTVALDEETARWARAEAARNEMSVSGFLRELLRERMIGEVDYSLAAERYLSRCSGEIGGSLPYRAEVQDRADLH